MFCFLFLQLAVGALGTAAGTVGSSNASQYCLQGAVPEDQRRYIQDDQGRNIPVGMLKGGWPSGDLMTEITMVLLREGLGYHAVVDDRLATYGASPIWALAGCENFDDASKRICGETETKIHVAVDSWIGSYAKEYEEMRTAHQSILPVILSSMGYDGEETLYVSEATFAAGYEDVGLALDFHRSYNRSHHDPKKYFSSTDDIPLTELSLCNATHMSNTERISQYFRYTGDAGGVRQQADGSYFAHCPDGVWWLSPACRENISGCIPTLTSSVGWRLQAMMHWSTVYGMPTAIGIIGDFSLWVQRVKRISALFYWWVPDSTFSDLRPLQIVFPRHSPSEWAAGDKKTSGAGSFVAKMVSSNLAFKARPVQEFVSQIKMELPTLQALLLRTQSEPVDAIACQWVKENEQTWQRWLPFQTKCFEGFGIVDTTGAYVSTRSKAASCGICQSGTFSDELEDEHGKTYRCASCPPGSSQSKASSTACEACPKGTATHEWGSEECTPCDVGSFQNLPGQSLCRPCEQHRTTRLLGATKQADCVCEAERIEENGACIVCMRGMSCPIGATTKQLLVVNSTFVGHPHLQAGYNSDPSAPLSTYKCVGSRCPGGSPGTCTGGLVGPTCGACPSQQFVGINECRDCHLLISVMWVASFILLLAANVCSYLLATSKYTHKATSLLCITTSLGMLFVLFQNVGVLHTMPISWPNGLSAILRFAALFLLSLQGLGLSCVTGSIASEYVASTGVFWLLLVTLPVVCLITKMIPYLVRREMDWNLLKVWSTIGQFFQVGFTTMASLGAAPFACFKHPSGQESILNYPGIFCGSNEQRIMQIFGGLLLFLATSFFVLCCFAAVKAPSWSGTPKLNAARFLVVRFRPDVWWFGLILLARGPFLSLPAIVLTGLPGFHLATMVMVLLLCLCLQIWFLPWKAPILNLVDALSNGFFVLLLAVSLAFLEVASEEERHLLEGTAVVFSVAM
ncbi:Ephrin_rec_like domain-containing protein, partial [Durusdinium trenchii]